MRQVDDVGCTPASRRSCQWRRSFPAFAAQLPHHLVQLRDVHLAYGPKEVLRGLNLCVRRGESLAIIGTSGTGKSTTLRIISGLEMPSKGQVLLNGEPRKFPLPLTLDRESPYASIPNPSLRISMVFQSAALFDSLTIAENISFPLRLHTSLPPDALESLVRLWLRRVGLPQDVYHKLPEQLSGGMKKRVAFARAVIFDPDDLSTVPDLLLYDEPSAGLSPVDSTRVENLIRGLQSFCPSCVVVTHQFSTIRRTADRVLFLHEGVAVWEGPVDELDVTENPYVRQFMSSSLRGPLLPDDDDQLPDLQSATFPTDPPDQTDHPDYPDA